MSKKCRAYSESRLGLEPSDNRKAFYAGWDAALRERLAQPAQDWDWRHPKAQALIGAKAWLEIKLRLVEQLVEDPNFETTASDMEYWEPLHDKLQGRLAQPEQEPMALETVYETIIHWDEGGGKRSRRELARRIVDLYTTPPQRKPLTNGEIYTAYITATNQTLRAQDERLALAFARAIESAHGIKGEA